MMKRKGLVLCLVCVLLFSMTACTGGGETPQTTPTTTDGETTTATVQTTTTDGATVETTVATSTATTTAATTAPQTTARLVIVRTTENGPMYKTLEDAEEVARVAAYVESLCDASLERAPAAGWHTMLRFENGDTPKVVTFSATGVNNNGKEYAVDSEVVTEILSLYEDLPMQALPYDFKQ